MYNMSRGGGCKAGECNFNYENSNTEDLLKDIRLVS